MTDISIDNFCYEFINWIETNNLLIKISECNFKYLFYDKINSDNSKLLFFEYSEKKIFILNIYFDSQDDKFKIYPIDYTNIKFEISLNSSLNLSTDIFWNFFENSIDNFISSLIELSKMIIQKFNIIKSYYSVYNSYQIYPFVNRVYLKNFIKNKYCVILIGITDYKITFNDDKEDWVTISNQEDLLTHKDLKIFRKIF